MNIEEFAAKISGFQYPAYELDRFSDEAKERGFLFISGYSGDLIETRGIYSDEIDAADGKVINVGSNGVKVDCQWCPNDDGTSWVINPDCEHAKFTIMEDGEVFCIGAVIHKDQLNA